MNSHSYLVPFDSSFRISESPTIPGNSVDSDKKLKKKLEKLNDELYELQRKLYAHNRYAILLVFQAMDAAGKDSAIRHIMRGVNPAGCQVFSFKQPSTEELDHDFLWRSAKRLPERGRIGIFNRSYYEETLVVRVHPEYLGAQNLPGKSDPETIWEERYRSIREHEHHLHRNGTVILKFWLNVSQDEQKNRFLDRLTDPAKNWKFSKSDIRERSFWDQYMQAYEATINATSRASAPWYAIPADNKKYARLEIAKIIVDTMQKLDCQYPEARDEEKQQFSEMEKLLRNENQEASD
jgi:PPK2 family polyphosphate:nucleotide phosphotransferase